MSPEHKEIIRKAMDDAFTVRAQFQSYAASESGQLKLAQLSLFQFISGAIVAIIALGYVYEIKFNHNYLIASFISAIVTLVFSVSVSREIIDKTSSRLSKTEEYIYEKTDIVINAGIDAITQNDSRIFFNLAEKETRKEEKNPVKMNYAGEIILLCFYLSIGFYILAVGLELENAFLSYQTLIVVLGAYALSFKDWAHELTDVLSIEINPFK